MSCARKVKKVSYDDYKGRVILGLVAYDNLQSKATVTILKGGIGYTHIVLRLRSERGWGLDYDIAVYALDRDRLTTTTTTTTPKPTTTQQPRLNINKRRLEIKSQYIKTLKEVPTSVI
ncbi:unnamed protein product [Plutella xylostella]|uniref:(diamondback moth) hypothetical protein n=1 Tax=Plutella xylostella TaxID=51655 RepID=A0A8S4F2Y1_PLUXY|nr:unnamed protein product [Plutella xylostella]